MQSTLEATLPWWVAGPVLGLVIVSLLGLANKRSGGRLAIADIVTSIQLPEGVTCDASLWAACIGSAMLRDDYRQTIQDAGFTLETLRENKQFRFVSERADNATQKYGVRSISLLAVKTP